MRTFEKPSFKRGAALTAGALLGTALLGGCGKPNSGDYFAASLRADTDRVLAGQQSQGNYKTIDTRHLAIAQEAVRKALETMRGRFFYGQGDSREDSTVERKATIFCWTASEAGLLTPQDRATLAEDFATGDALLETGTLNDNVYVYNQNYGYTAARNRCDNILTTALEQGTTIGIPIAEQKAN